MDDIISDPKNAFIIMLNERLGKVEENMFHFQQNITNLKEKVHELEKIIYCERMHVFINDGYMFINEAYHDRLYDTVKSLHQIFVELMPIKKIYYITNINKIPKIHMYIIFYHNVPYDCMKQTINTLVIRKLANLSIKISSIFWKKITEENEDEINGYLNKKVYIYEELDGKIDI